MKPLEHFKKEGERGYVGKVVDIKGILDTYPNTSNCWIQLINIEDVKKDAYIIIEDAKRDKLRFIGRVMDIKNFAELLSDMEVEVLKKKVNPEEFIKGSLSDLEFFKVYALVDLMYKLDGDDISSVDTPPTHGSNVYKASSKDLPNVFGFTLDKNKSVCIGYLSVHSDVEVCLDLNKLFSTHIVIFGQTGSGKSYATGVLIEEVVKRGVPVVVFDHMGEYVDMDKAVDGGKGLNLMVFEPERNLAISFEDLMDQLEILASSYNPPMSDTQKELLLKVFNRIRNMKSHKKDEPVPVLLDDVLNELENMGKQPSGISGHLIRTINALKWRLESLKRRNIISQQGIKINDLVKQGYLTVIDVSKSESWERNILVALILRKLIDERKRNSIKPSIVVIEEAHNYISREETPSSITIRDLVRGARHFGIGVVLVSQRPAGMHPDAINIVNTRMIFRLVGSDLDYIRDLTNLDKDVIEDIKRLNVGEAYLSTPLIRNSQPIKVRIRARKTKHGGHSINFI